MQRRGSRPAVRSRRGVGLRAAMMAADGGAEEEAQHGAASFRGGCWRRGRAAPGSERFRRGGGRGDGAGEVEKGRRGRLPRSRLGPRGGGARREWGVGGECGVGLCGRGRMAAPGGERGERWVEC